MSSISVDDDKLGRRTYRKNDSIGGPDQSLSVNPNLVIATNKPSTDPRFPVITERVISDVNGMINSQPSQLPSSKDYGEAETVTGSTRLRDDHMAKSTDVRKMSSSEFDDPRSTNVGQRKNESPSSLEHRSTGKNPSIDLRNIFATTHKKDDETQ